MSVKLLFGLKAKVFIMNADYAVIRDLVILNEPYIWHYTYIVNY